MILQNFKLSEGRDELIGISGKRLMNFLKKFASSHSPYKMYCLKIVEVTHSQLSRNYLYTILGQYADELGCSTEAVEKRFLRKLADLVRSEYDDLYTKKIFFDEEVVDTFTGEIYEAQCKTVSKFSTTAMVRFIDFCMAVIATESPEFKIPDPNDYMEERQGEKNKILFPEERIILK